MRFYEHERLALIIDGPNLWNAAKALGFEVDFGKLQGFFARQGMLVASCYFALLREDGEFSPVRPLTDWMSYNGWQTFTRDKDTDVDLAVHALELSASLDHLVLASGDSDFVSLVQAVQRKGCRVSVLSTTKTGVTSGGVSDDLRRAADNFMDLNDMRETISRPARVPKEALNA